MFFKVVFTGSEAPIDTRGQIAAHVIEDWLLLMKGNSYRFPAPVSGDSPTVNQCSECCRVF